MMLADRPAVLTLSRQTMAPVCLLRLPRWQYRANICTNRPTTTRCTAPWPCWAKRSWHLDDGEKIMSTGATQLSNPEKCARSLPVHGADRGHHGGQREQLGALRFDASCTHHHHRRLIWRLNHGQNADSQPSAQRSLRLNPLVWEQPWYSLCTYVASRLTVLPRSHTVSVAVTIRLRDVKRACFPRPKSGWQSGTTSSGRSRRLYFLPMYPYPRYARGVNAEPARRSRNQFLRYELFTYGYARIPA